MVLYIAIYQIFSHVNSRRKWRNFQRSFMRSVIFEIFQRKSFFFYQSFLELRKIIFVPRIINILQKALIIRFHFINIERKLRRIFVFCNQMNRLIRQSGRFKFYIDKRLFDLIFLIFDVF